MTSQAERGRAKHQPGRRGALSQEPARLADMTDADRLHETTIDELRSKREQCKPKPNQNPRLLRYPNAVGAL